MSDKTVATITCFIAACVTALAVVIALVVFQNAEHKRNLMKSCLATERNAQDCHNAVYGFNR